MKTLVATAVYKAIENGELSLEKRLSGSTVENHLERMINRSDNNSWELFYDHLGIEKIQALAQELGLNQIKINGNEGSAANFATLLHLLYNQDLINNQHRKQLFGFMQDTETENLLTLGIPKNTSFYHKTGKYEGGMHDAMIVDLEKNPYIIVVLSSNDKGLITNRSEKFKQISKTVFNHFNQ